MSSHLLQPTPPVGDVLSLPIDRSLRRGYYSNDPMARTVLQQAPETQPQIATPGTDGAKPRLGDQNLMELFKKTLQTAAQTTESKEAMPSSLDWRK